MVLEVGLVNNSYWSKDLESNSQICAATLWVPRSGNVSFRNSQCKAEVLLENDVAVVPLANTHVEGHPFDRPCLGDSATLPTDRPEGLSVLGVVPHSRCAGAILDILDSRSHSVIAGQLMEAIGEIYWPSKMMPRTWVDNFWVDKT